MSDANEKKPVNKFASKMKANRHTGPVTMDQLLLSGTNNSPESSSPVSDSESQFKLPPERFYPLKQVRTEIDDHSIYELAQTFLTHGQLQAITVYPPDADGRYCIYNGERRWRAAQLIPDFTLDAKIMTGQVLEAAERTRKAGGFAESGHGAPDTIPSSSEFEADSLAPLDGASKESRILLLSGLMIENDQREPLSVLDTARTLQELFALTGSQEEVAKTVGWYTSGSGKPNINRVSRYLGILKLPQEGIELVQSKVLQDLTIIELLRKISELDKASFERHIALAREGQVTRAQLDAELKRIKEPASPSVQAQPSHQQGENHQAGQTQQLDPGLNNKPKTQPPSKPKLAPEERTIVQQPKSLLPSITFNVEGSGLCKLCLTQNVRDGYALVEFESGLQAEIAFSELQVHSIHYDPI